MLDGELNHYCTPDRERLVALISDMDEFLPSRKVKWPTRADRQERVALARTMELTADSAKYILDHDLPLPPLRRNVRKQRA